MKSLLMLNIINAKTSELGTVFLNYQSIRICGVSAARLSKFYYIIG